MRIVVDETTVTISEQEEIVAGSVNIHTVEFDCDSTWDGYTKKAIFRVKNGSETIVLDDTNKCLIPYETLLVPGELKIGIYGTNGDKIRPTKWSKGINIVEGTMEGDALESIFPIAEEVSF